MYLEPFQSQPFNYKSNISECLYIQNVMDTHGISITSPPQRPMTSDFEGFSIADFIHHIYVPILILEKKPLFPFLMIIAKHGNYWYHFLNVFGMTRSLTGD